MADWDLVQEALDHKPESLKCTHTNGSKTRVMIWSGHGKNEQFVLHINKAYGTVCKTGLISVVNDAEKAYDLKKEDYKDVLVEPADEPLSKAKQREKDHRVTLVQV